MAMAHRPCPISKEGGEGCASVVGQGDGGMVSIFDVGLTFSLRAIGKKNTRTTCNLVY